MTLTLYLAGPDVFLPDARQVGERKVQLCREFGFDGLFPLVEDPALNEDPTHIFTACCDLMRRADMGVFNLTPFRGPSADCGTSFELGFMFAAGKRLFGYTSNPRDYRARVDTLLRIEKKANRIWDGDGFAVENLGLVDNLMIDRAIVASGGTITAIAPSGHRRAANDLAAYAAFRGCLGVIKERVEQSG
jgi:nucleoside 2-deoxyribosyltransferase